MTEEIETSRYPEGFLEVDLAELYAYPLEVVEGYMDQAVNARDAHFAIIFAREIIRKNGNDNSDSTYEAYRILASAYNSRKNTETVIYLLGLMIKKFTVFKKELRKVLQKLTQKWTVNKVNRVLSEYRRRPHLCSYDLLFQYAERANERRDVKQEIEFREALLEITPNEIDALTNLAAALNRARDYGQEVIIREEIASLLGGRPTNDATLNLRLLTRARALEEAEEGED